MEDNFESRIVSGYSQENENIVETRLRPRVLEEYIGQSKVKEKCAFLSKRQGAWRGAGSCPAVWSAGDWERRPFPIS